MAWMAIITQIILWRASYLCQKHDFVPFVQRAHHRARNLAQTAGVLGLVHKRVQFVQDRAHVRSLLQVQIGVRAEVKHELEAAGSDLGAL